MKVIKRGRFNPEIFEYGQNSEEVPVRLMRKPTTDCENQKTKRLFNLSLVDIKVIAYALSEGHKVATGDAEIKDFAEQEFADAYKGSISPLGMINLWLQRGLIKWSDQKHDYLADWAALNEDPQPNRQKNQFRKLTGRTYPGS